MKYGYCVNMLARDNFGVGYEFIPVLHELGFDYIDLPIAQIMDMDERQFEELILAPLKDAGLPCLCANNLFPSLFRLTGPDARRDEALEYAKRAFPRIARMGAVYTVFGSSGARNMPLGWSLQDGERQLAEVLTALIPIADEYGITFVIEPLNRGESNIINTIADGLRLAQSVRHPRVMMLADTYHMALAGDGNNALELAGSMLRHVHVARPLGRTVPARGDGEDYAGFFKTLKSIGYKGGISIEAYSKNPQVEVSTALRYLREIDNESVKPE